MDCKLRLIIIIFLMFCGIVEEVLALTGQVSVIMFLYNCNVFELYLALLLS